MKTIKTKIEPKTFSDLTIEYILSLTVEESNKLFGNLPYELSGTSSSMAIFKLSNTNDNRKFDLFEKFKSLFNEYSSTVFSSFNGLISSNFEDEEYLQLEHGSHEFFVKIERITTQDIVDVVSMRTESVNKLSVSKYSDDLYKPDCVYHVETFNELLTLINWFAYNFEYNYFNLESLKQ